MRSLSLLAVIFLTACSGSVITGTYLGKQPANGAAGAAVCKAGESGMIYSLPRAFIPLTVEFGKKVYQPTASQTKKIQDATKAIGQAKEKLNEPNLPPTDAKTLRELIDSKTAEIAKVRAAAMKPGFKASADKPIYYPDPAQTYRLCYNANAGSDDEVEIKASASGLLASISVSADDRTDDVLRKLTEGVVEVAKLGALPSLALQGLRKERTDEPDPYAVCRERDYSFRVLIDPTDPGSAIESINGALDAVGVPKKCLEFKSLDIPASDEGSYTPPAHPEAVALCSQGACYRRAWPAAFTVTEKSTNSGSSFLAEVPNEGPIGMVDFRRATFVKIEAAADFDNGMLTRVKYVKPSQALAVASLPVDILKSIVSIPAAAFETRSGRIKAEAQMVEAQAALIKAQSETGPNSSAQVAELEREIAVLELLAKRQALLDAQGVQ